MPEKFSQSDLERAIKYAVDAHAGMKRKLHETPYILHPLEVAVIAGTLTEDPEIIAAAALHDTVEDTSVTIEDIKREFGERVAFLVSSETEDKHRELPPDESWMLRKKESLEYLRDATDIGIKIMWLSDKLSNVRNFFIEKKTKGKAFWQKFNQKDEKKQEWYYRTISEYTKELSDTPVWKAYNNMIDQLFGDD